LLRRCLASLALLFLAACDEQKIEDFVGREPRLDFIDYFTGKVTAWGLITDRFGTVRRQFTVAMHGRLEDGKLILTEDFVYADGETRQRIWTVARAGAGYVATAPDVRGAALGEQAGNAVRFAYDIEVPIGGSTWLLSADDWLFLQPGGEVALNQSTLSKWGIEVARVNIAFRKAN
jgi:hypothetical protein